MAGKRKRLVNITLFQSGTNKFVNNRPSSWTANCAALEQCGPLQKR